jgi:hypothetical protein
MLGISKHAHPHLGTRNVGQLHGATETLVFLRVIVLQTDLKFNSLCELPVLLLGSSHDLGDGLPENIALKLTVATRASNLMSEEDEPNFKTQA